MIFIVLGTFMIFAGISFMIYAKKREKADMAFGSIGLILAGLFLMSSFIIFLLVERP
jgi:hypothetical protein